MPASGGPLPLETVDPSWEIWLQRFNGVSIGTLTRMALDARLMANLNGLWSFSLSLSLPELFKQFGIRDVELDSIIEFRYKRGVVRNFSFIKRKTVRDKDTLTISGYGLNHLLKRRNTGAYYAQTSFTKKDDFLDDMLLEIVRENLGASAVDRDTGAADNDRRLTEVAGFNFSVAAEAGDAPQYELSFHGKNVYELLLELADISAQAGTRLFFNIERTGVDAFEFRTYTGSQGVDRRGAATFGEKQGNVTGAETLHDHMDEINFFFVAGQGPGTSRAYVEVENTDAINTSPLNRNEGFRDARQTPTAELTQVGYRELERYKAIKLYNGRLIDQEGSRFGLDWDLGDLLSAQDESEEFSIMVTAVEVELNQGRQQLIEGRFTVIEDA